MFGRPSSAARSSLGEAAFRTDQHRERDRLAVPARARADSAATGSLTSASSSQNTSSRAGSRSATMRSKASGGADLGQCQDAALLGGLDRVGPHPIEIDAR